MDCRAFREVFSDYVDGVLDGAGTAGARAHLSSCERCRRFDRAYRLGLTALQGLPAPAPSRDFGARVVNSVRRRPEALYPSGAPAFAGSLLALTVAGLFLLSPAGYVKPAPEPRSAGSAPRLTSLPKESARYAADVITVRFVSTYDDRAPDPYPSILLDDQFVTTSVRFEVPAVWTGR